MVAFQRNPPFAVFGRRGRFSIAGAVSLDHLRARAKEIPSDAPQDISLIYRSPILDLTIIDK